MVASSASAPPGFGGAFRTDRRARAAYAEGAGIYRILPAAIAIPESVADLQSLVRWAEEGRMPLTPRGAGSAVSGSNTGAGTIVDLGRLWPRTLQVDAQTRRAITSPAITHQELGSAAASEGLRLPPDPSSGAFATLGGMVATNAAGARSVRFGPVRPWVRALEVVTGDGAVARLERGMPVEAVARLGRSFDHFVREVDPEIRRASALIEERFPRTTKNTSGLALDAYLKTGDVLDLFIGSEGSLGFISQIEWELDTVPTVIGGLRLSLADLDALAEMVAALRTLRPSALELLDRSFLDVLPEEQRSAGEALLLVEFEGDDPKTVRGRVGDAARLAGPQALDVATALSNEELADLWRVRHAASPMLARLPDSQRSLQVIEDGCVPVERLGEYLRFVRRVSAEYGIPVVIFGHAGDGHLHVNLLPDVDRPGWEHRVAQLWDRVTDEVLRLGGTPAGEHGDGRLRAGLVERLYGPELMGLLRKVKAVFDPGGVFNPGVVLPDQWRPLEQLKVGDRRVDLPQDIERGLREMERSAGWGRPRLTLADGS